MQQAIYTNTTPANIAVTAPALPVRTVRSRKARLLRHLMLKWDLYGVLALLVSSAAYGVYAIAHVL